MVEGSQRTIYGLDINLSMLMGREYVIKPNTTLNEKFDILKDITLEDNEYPNLMYFTIGVGGSDIVTNIGGYEHSKHMPQDAALYEHIPFVIRTKDNDITEDEQANYRFRKLETFNGVEYICYYLKLIDKQTLLDNFYTYSVVGGKPVLSLMDTNTDVLLNPDPKVMQNPVDYENSSYVSKVVNLQFELSKSEINDIDEILKIMYGVNNTKAITEIGVCTGVERTTDTGIEAGAVQICYHIDVTLDTQMMIQADSEFIRTIEIGGAEPLVM